MQVRLVWVLPLLVCVGACKGKREPELIAPDEPPVRYGDRVWTESAPAIEPLAVCEHLARLVAAEAGVSDLDLDPTMIRECEADLTLEAGARGTDNWNEIATCVLQARTEADIDFCDRSHPMPGTVGPGPTTPPSGASLGARELAVCDHMIGVFEHETEAATGEPPPLTETDRRELVEECASALVFEQKPQLDPDAYTKMLACIEGARSSEQLRACE